MPMRMRIRGPGWTEQVSAEEDWTIQKLVDHIKEKKAMENFALKYGFPPTALDLSSRDTPLSSLGLDGETLSLIPIGAPPSDPSPESSSAVAGASSAPQAPTTPAAPAFKPKRVEPDELSVAWPERDGYIMLRVMPDDNSCMFTAFGGAVQLDDPAPVLRHVVADYILAHPEKYSKAILENKEPRDYVRHILDKDAWGGYIELGILSDIYDIEICSIDVGTLRVDKYGQGKAERCVILYSGIHYDRIVFAMDVANPVEWDETKWSTADDGVLEKAVNLAAELKRSGYNYDANEAVTRCNVPGCHWIGQGEKAMIKHMTDTGHSAFEQIEDS